MSTSVTQNHRWAQATVKDDGVFCFRAVFQVGAHGTPSAQAGGAGHFVQWGCGTTLLQHSSGVFHPWAQGEQMRHHGRLSPNWRPGGQQQPLWRWGWGRQVLFPRPERSSQEWKAGVRKLAKVSQVPLALPNPLFHPQPLETPLIPPSAVSGGVPLLLQD